MAPKRSVAQQKRRQKMKISLTKRVKASNYSTTTGYRQAIQARLHLIQSSGSYGHTDFKAKIGPFNFDYKYFNNNRRKLYAEKWDKSIDGFKIILLTKSLKAGLPKSVIKITPPDPPTQETKKMIQLQVRYKNFLHTICNLFPNLKLSSIEYAIDLWFREPSEVESAFDVLKRNVFVPRTRAKPIIYQNSIRIGKHKIYKRGYDLDKSKNGWSPEKINRVRMEYTCKSAELKKNGLRFLRDLVKSSMYFKINTNKWNFKNFDVIRSKKLPGELDPYSVDGSFQGEYIAAKEKVRNRSRRLTDARGLEWFKEDLRDAMRLHDLRW